MTDDDPDTSESIMREEIRVKLMTARERAQEQFQAGVAAVLFELVEQATALKGALGEISVDEAWDAVERATLRAIINQR